MNLGNGSLKGAWGEKHQEGKRRMSCIREMKEEIERKTKRGKIIGRGKNRKTKYKKMRNVKGRKKMETKKKKRNEKLEGEKGEERKKREKNQREEN